MPGLGPLKPKDRLYRSTLEPRELLKRQKQLAVIQEQPETVLRDVRDLSF
jgi:hypothetical protein